MKVVIAASNGHSLINFRGPLIKDIASRGHKVYCISLEPASEMVNKVSALGAEYVQVHMSRTGTAILEDIKTIKEFKKVLKEINPDVFFASMSKPVAYGGMAAKSLKIPHCYVLVTGLEIAFYSGGIKNAIVRKVLTVLFGNTHKACDRVFFQNYDDMNRFKDIGIVKDEQAVIVHGSGVDMDLFKRTPLPDAPVMMMVARLVWSKGIREYLDAARIVKQKHPEARFLLVGGLDNNPESLSKEELKKAIEENTVEYIGFSDKMYEELDKCSVFVLPSYHEGLPRSVLEAMSKGRAIVTTDAPGCRETVVDGKNGYIVPVGDGNKLADKINLLVESPELRSSMGEESYKMCKENFEVSIISNKLINEMGL